MHSSVFFYAFSFSLAFYFRADLSRGVRVFVYCIDLVKPIIFVSQCFFLLFLLLPHSFHWTPSCIKRAPLTLYSLFRLCPPNLLSFASVIFPRIRLVLMRSILRFLTVCNAIWKCAVTTSTKYAVRVPGNGIIQWCIAQWIWILFCSTTLSIHASGLGR